jgi:riboflavin synthase
MFTGLIQQLGQLKAITHAVEGPTEAPPGLVWTVQANAPEDDPLVLGESIALNGVCTTVTSITEDGQGFTVLLSPETLNVTTLQHQQPGTKLNIERSLRASDRLGGHWVTGHVDSQGVVVDVQPDGSCWRIVIRLLNSDMAPLVLPKGSITVDGISLTVNEVQPLRPNAAGQGGIQFGVAIIPHTWDHTIIHTYAHDTLVNLECDLMGKYVQQWIAPYLGQTSDASKAAVPPPRAEDGIPDAFFPNALGTSHIHTGRWFNLQGPPQMGP